MDLLHMRAWRRACLAVAILTAAALLAPPARAGDDPLLKPGQSVFWSGPQGPITITNPLEPFDETYGLETDDGGGRLRVALDVVQYRKEEDTPHEKADEGRDFTLQVLKESEELVAVTVGTGYSVEAFICFDGDPCLDSFEHNIPFCEDEPGDARCAVGDAVAQPFKCDRKLCHHPYGHAYPDTPGEDDSGGEWTIRVTADDVDDWTFRLRAMLERLPDPDDAQMVVLPNLRSRPPFELTLDCTPTVGYGAFIRRGACDTAALPAVPPGCSAQEVAELPDVRWCMRFSGGNENAGDGGLEIVGGVPELEQEQEDGKLKLKADAFQVIRNRDEQEVERHHAGDLVFEDSHGHWHYDGFMQYELFAVVERRGGQVQLVELGGGIKRGWCPADELISDWADFNQVPQRTGPTTDVAACFLATPNAVFGQSAGWGDVYEWQREEQFVPFPVDATGKPEVGKYVLRETIDPNGHLKESDERDNAAYAYFEVSGNGSITIIERGYGSDPWDPHKKTV